MDIEVTQNYLKPVNSIWIFRRDSDYFGYERTIFVQDDKRLSKCSKLNLYFTWWLFIDHTLQQNINFAVILRFCWLHFNDGLSEGAGGHGRPEVLTAVRGAVTVLRQVVRVHRPLRQHRHTPLTRLRLGLPL